MQRHQISTHVTDDSAELTFGGCCHQVSFKRLMQEPHSSLRTDSRHAKLLKHYAKQNTTLVQPIRYFLKGVEGGEAFPWFCKVGKHQIKNNQDFSTL